MAPTKSKASIPKPKAGKRKYEDEAEAPKKKAKVQSPRKVDPVETAIEKVMTAVNFDLYSELPEKVVTIVASITPDALSTTVEERSELENSFAKAIGDSLKHATNGLNGKADDAAKALTECEAEVTTLTEKHEASLTAKKEADEAVATATDEEKTAKEAKNTAIVALNDQKAEEGKLDETKDDLEKQRTTLQFALDLPKQEAPPSAKDLKKFATILTEAGAAEALVKGAPVAIGKESEFDKMFLDMAIKLIDGKMAEVQAKQNDWGTHTSNMAAKTKEMEEEVAALSTTFTEKQTALTNCKATQKTAGAAVKDAEKALAKGKKAVEEATEAKTLADNAVASAAEVYAAYEFLATRSSAPAEPERVEEPEAAEEPAEFPDEAAAEAADEPMEAVDAAEEVAAF